MSNHSGRRNRTANGNKNNSDGRGGFFMSSSPVAWLSFALGIITMAGYVYQIGSTNATFQAEFKSQREQIERNFREDAEQRKHLTDMIVENKREFTAAVTRIDSQIGNMAKLQTEVEIIKVQLTTMNETMKDVRRVLERAMLPTIAAPAKGPHHHKQ